MKTKWTYYPLAAALLLTLSASAQQGKFKFQSINTVGLAAGESKPSAILQTVNGVTYIYWSAAVGVGLDYYAYKTIPLFLDLRRNMGRSFLYGSLGYNFPWDEKPGKEITFYNSYHFTGGLYSDIGVGYKMNFNKKPSFIFSAGYSHKKIQNKVGVVSPCLVAPCPEEFITYNYGFGRIVLKAGIELK